MPASPWATITSAGRAPAPCIARRIDSAHPPSVGPADAPCSNSAYGSTARARGLLSLEHENRGALTSHHAVAIAIEWATGPIGIGRRRQWAQLAKYSQPGRRQAGVDAAAEH